MSVRAAKFQDIPGIVAVMESAHKRSIYAETGTFDEAEAKHMVLQAIHRHGHENLGGSLVLVSEDDDGKVVGFIVGVLDVVYPGLKELMATDLLFIMDTGADPRDAASMLKQMTGWAQNNPKVIELHLGINNAIGNWERTAKLYQRLGLQQCGAMFRREFER